jgi:IS605 OrfB family transposase
VLVLEDLRLPQPTKRAKPGTAAKPTALRRRLSLFAHRVYRAAIEARAQRTGLAVAAVDPRGTSQRHWRCGKSGIRKRHRFTCLCCNRVEHADTNAARNIRDLYRADPARWARHQGAQKPPQREARHDLRIGVT